MAYYIKLGILLGLASLTITASAQVTASFTNSTTCGTTSISFTNTSSGATSQVWFFDWPNTSDNSTAANPTKNYPSYGTYQVVLVVSGPGGSDTAVKTITPSPNPTVSVSRTGPAQVCGGNTVQLTATQNSSYTYAWQPASGLDNPVVYNPNAFIDSTITYTVVVTDESTGCKSNGNIKVDAVYCFPVANFQFLPPACGEFTVDFKDFSQGAYTYQWIFDDGATGPNNTSTQKAPTHTFSKAGTFTVRQTVFGKNGESSTITHDVVIYNKVNFSILNADTAICDGVTLNLKTTGGGTVSWSPPDWLSALSGQSVSSTPHGSISYIATLTTGLCSFSDTVNIGVKPVPDADFTTDTFCITDAVPFSIKKPTLDSVTYFWDLGDNTVDSGTSIVHTYARANIYQVTATASRKGCVNKVTRLATVLQTPHPRFVYAPRRVFFDSATVFFTNQSQYSTQFLWDFGDGTTSNTSSPLHSYSDTGLYIISLVSLNNNGCGDTAYDTIKIVPSFFYYIPDALTPSTHDGDKGPLVNNTFKVTANGEMREFSMQIFDRWGEKVCDTGDNNTGWDGTNKHGNECTTGLYIYSIRFKNPGGVNVYEKGKVMLLR